MNIELIKKWVFALRSGKYRQTKETLCEYKNKRANYCCLGVLARVADCKIDDVRRNAKELLSKKFIKKFNLIGLPQSHLATMNDRGDKFSHIANYIEKRYLNENKTA